jgi:anti-sigma-K factor RskA
LHSHDEYKDKTIGHALSALGEAEAREMDEHLEKCADCRAEFDSWNETASSLAFAADIATPSSDVRTRILQQARTLPSPASESQGRPEKISDDGPAPKTADIIPMRRPVRRTWSTFEKWGAIAASLVIALLLGTVIVLWQRTKAMEADVTRLTRQARETEQDLARVREENGLLTAPDARMTSLTGTDMARNARAMIAYDRTTGHAMLVANGLPIAPEGHAYQLWFIPKGKQPMPGGVFATNAAGHAEMRDMVPPEGRDDATFAVTLERAGGVPAPQGKIYLQGTAS